ncbi:putative C6 finger domain protein [Aspergillus melleus]|uniref:putative C6 finger domain protein n=1 Tax=Aspergillus melleus TaxID=138277 RepID=UPI001E8E84CE|nr:uncharacterized protein LDX57_009305 [Aspergillus melleus]KAH8431649.1 hypothetical protein LDX57_009305 [Aspergillus melleus]
MPAAVENMTSTTPNSQAAVMDSSAADKKRNKLGYHRTSVACVHCRRRKIRCLVAADDAQGRCENCIRLRKECQFFPVDQQPPVEKKSRPSSRLENASTDPSTASSSPPTGSGGEQTEAFFPYQPIPLNTGPDVTALNPGGFPGNPMAQFAPDRNVGAAEFAPGPSLDPSVPWDEFTTIQDPQVLANMTAAGKHTMMNMAPGVWSPGPNPMAGMPTASALPGTPTVPSQSQALNPATGYTLQPDGSVWPMAPPRSMTFPAQAEMPIPYAAPGQFQQQIPPDLKRRMTSPAQGYPRSPVNPQSPASTDLQGTPVSVSYPGQPPAMGYTGWPDLSNMSPMNVVQYPMYTGDGTPQAPFGSPQPPMGHPGSGQSPP